jgi:hypothetical protein
MEASKDRKFEDEVKLKLLPNGRADRESRKEGEWIE